MLDVAILHEIVVHAQDLLPSLPEGERVPTNALFHAYYAILPTLGIDAHHDNRYARILFKIGGMRGEGTLYERFETVLSRMGIEIQLDHEDTASSVGFRNQAAAYREADYIYPDVPLPEASSEASAHRRRHSEGSYQDSILFHSDVESIPRLTSLSPPYRSDIQHRDTSVGTIETGHKPEHGSADAGDLSHGQNKNHVSGTGLRDGNDRNVRTRARSASPRADTRYQPILSAALDNDPVAAYPPPLSPRMSALGQTPRHTEDSTFDVEAGNPVLPLKLNPMLDEKVELLRDLHAKIVLRQSLHQWHTKALKSSNENGSLDAMAKLLDRRTLLRQAVESWRSRRKERYQLVETQRFFDHLERKADRARDIFLLNKAFSHWAYSASDEIQRTSLARRHILRTRYFQAWSDVTVNNEFKVRRHTLGRFVLIWKKQHFNLTNSAHAADNIYTANLLKKTFWTWFWMFCSRRAPVWRANKLERRGLTAWARLSTAVLEDAAVARRHYEYSTCSKVFSIWKQKMLVARALERRAEDSRRTTARRRVVDSWLIHLNLMPLLRSTTAGNDAQLKSLVLGSWSLRARQQSYAATIDYCKVLHEALLNWRNMYRCQLLHNQTRERLQSQGLHRWILAARFELSKRCREQRLLGVFLATLLNSSRSRSGALQRLVQRSEEFHSKKSIVNSLRKWRNSCATRNVQLEAASSTIALKAERRYFTTWSGQNQRIRQLSTWARDSEFYFVASKSLQKWKVVTEVAKRERRRKAYSDFRRRTKINLATKVLSLWHGKAQRVIQLESKGEDMYRKNRHATGERLFEIWRHRTRSVIEMEFAGHQVLLRTLLDSFQSKLEQYNRAILLANYFYMDHQTSSSMKRWLRVALQLRARHHMVIELNEKHAKRTLRRMVMHWQERAAHLHSSRAITSAASSDTGTRRSSKLDFLGRPPESTNTDLDEWEDDGDDTIGPTSLPGYLMTPSRRVTRATATATLSSTTPSAPLSTPAERLLRAHYSGGAVPPSQRALGRSLLGQDSRVER